MIQVSQLEFRYREGRFRLSVPELAVATGETVAVIGASGSGKSTLLNLVAGILEPSVGRVEVGGVAVSDLAEPARRAFRLRRVGLVFQEFELLEHLDVLDNVLLPCRISSEVKLDGGLKQRAAELVREVGLGDKLRRNVRRLSQGERQRVALARALLLEPPLLLCDEPTGNLDPVTATAALDRLFEQVERRRTTLLAVTHDHDLLGRFQRVVDMKSFHAGDAA
jgi:putative ABC transport system ATP-binding protein